MGWGLLLALALVPGPGDAPPASPVHPPADAVVPGPAKVVTLHDGDVVVFRMSPQSIGQDLVVVRAGAAARDGRLAAGEMRARLDRLEGTQTLLTLENATPLYISYQAVVTDAAGSTTPTAVCTLLPNGQPSFEHWNQPVEALTLFGFRAVDEGSAGCG